MDANSRIMGNQIVKEWEVVEIWLLRGMSRVSWTERKTNAEELRAADVTRKLNKIIRES